MRQRVMIAIALSCNPKLLHRRRADHRPRCHRAEADPRPPRVAAGRARHGDDPYHPRPRSRRRPDRPDRCHVRRPGRRGGRRRVLFDEIRHPYTEALLASIPRIEHNEPHPPRSAIAGRPPTWSSLRPGCRFAPRCQSRPGPSAWRSRRPRLGVRAGGHRFACFFPVGTPPARRRQPATPEAGRTAAGLDLDVEALS